MKNWMIALLVAVMAFVSAGAMAADAPKVAIADPARIFSEMQELKDLRAKMDSDRKLLEGMDSEKRQSLQALKASRDALKSGTPQFQEKNADLRKAAIEYEAWSKISQADYQREQKNQMRSLYEKIEKTIGEVAKQKGFDLVIADHRPELPEELDQMNMDQIRGLINARTVLYSNEKVDISADVLAVLDANYRSASTTSPAAK